VATGLLGINPYYKGVSIDISKPINLAIQLQQKEQAKAEALERYYMDYEKSINPKGLGRGEAEVFNKKFNTAREYWMKNKEAILNPRRYGMDAQSTYMAALKDAQGYIELGKQATAERKAFSDFVKKQIAQGKRISDNYLGVMENAMKPVEAGYVAPDISQIKIYDPHDDFSFVDKTWKGIDLPGNIINEKEIIVERGKPKETGRVRPVMQEEITKDVADTYAQRARGYYRSNDGTQEQYNILFQDKDFKKQMNPIFTKYFNRDISSPEDLLVAQGLASKSPKREAKGVFEVPDPTWMQKFNMTQAAINARADKYNQGTTEEGNLLDQIGGYGKPVSIGMGGGVEFKIDNGIVVGKDNKPMPITKAKLPGKFLPQELFSVLAKAGTKIYADDDFSVTSDKNGNILSIQSPDGGIITRQAIRNAQLAAYSEPMKGEQPGFVPPTPKPQPSSSKTYTNAEEKMIAAAMKANKGYTREQIIEAAIKAGKLKK